MWMIAELLAFVAFAAPPATFTDPRGDAGGAPDVVRVTVGADGDALRFEVELAAALVSDDTVFVAIDADNSAATGDQHGIDLVADVKTTGGRLRRWDGARLAPAGAPREARVDGNRVVVVLGSDGPGFRDRIAFGVVASGNGASDAAPGSGTWTYVLRRSVATFTAITVRSTPNKPIAGKRFALRARARLSDGRTVVPARVTCRARIGRPALPRGCSWRLPSAARGRRLVVRVTAAYGGRTRTRTLAYAVR
jgi:hypothetical protein